MIDNSDIMKTANAAYAVGLRGDNLITAIAIAGAESGYRLGAAGDMSIGGSYGPWQIHLPAHPQYTQSWLTASYSNNAEAMYSISGGGGNWNAWSTYVGGQYRSHLAEASEAAAAATGATDSTGGSTVAARADHLTEPFGSAIDKLLAAYPGTTINSGFRSLAEQEALWANSAQDGVMVAQPGRDCDASGYCKGGSYHQQGMAVDLGFPDDATRQAIHANAAKFGLQFPMDYEDWHIEPIGSRDGTYVPLTAGSKLQGIMGIGNPLDNVAGALGSVGEFFGKLSWFTKSHNLIRVGQGWAGTTLIIGGILVMSGAAKTVRQAAEVAVNVGSGGVSGMAKSAVNAAQKVKDVA